MISIGRLLSYWNNICNSNKNKFEQDWIKTVFADIDEDYWKMHMQVSERKNRFT